MPAWASGAWATGAWAGTAWAESGITVPDVVGQSQASGTAELEGVGFVVQVATAYSNVVALGDIISQSPAAGAEVPEGSTVIITVSLGPEPVTENKGAGRKRRRRYVVEIDGQDFEVSSPGEAADLLAKARQFTEQTLEKARSASIQVRPGIKRPVIRTRDPELKPIVQQARQEITSLYDTAVRDLEIAALMAKQIEDEEEEALIRLLM